MRMFKWALAGTATVVVAGFLAVTALGSGVLQAQEPKGDRERIRSEFTQELAERLGITVQELNADRKAALEAVLAQAVAEGRITQAQADRIHEHPLRAGAQVRHNARAFAVDILAAAAKTLNMSTEDLRAALKDGKTLAQVASDKGVSTAALKSGMTTAIDAQLDAPVADGKLTQEQADKIASGLSERLDKVLSGEGRTLRDGVRPNGKRP